MSFLGHLSDAKLQNLMFLPWELLGKVSVIGVVSLLSKPQPEAIYPLPKFKIGDLVADYWTDEFDKECIEYGQVLGTCWHPHQQTWAYLIEWTGGGMPDSCYPCFNEHLVVGGDLRLVKQS